MKRIFFATLSVSLLFVGTSFAGACLLITLCAIPSSAQTAALYVATNGKDSNPGTLERPFATISAAANAASPGTDVIVRGGIYRGTVSINTSGTPGARIRFYPYNGERVIIDGTGTPAGTSLVTMHSGSNRITFSGFEVRNAASAGIDVYQNNNNVIINNIVHNSFSAGIIVESDTPGTSFGNRINGNTVYNNSINNITLGKGIIWAQGIRAAQSNYAVITGNVVYNNYGEGISSGASSGVTIAGNTVFDNYVNNIYLNNAPWSVVTGNLVYSTGNSQFFLQGLPAVGIAAANETTTASLPLSNEVITNNIIVGGVYGIYYENFGAGGGLQNSLIANNTVVNTTNAAIHFDAGSSAANQLVNNIFYLSSPGTLQSGSSRGFSFGNNCWFGGSSGMFAGAGDANANPLFVLPGSFSANSYMLSSVSPCLASGRKLTEVGVNYWGTSRSAPYSSGAY